ncbi:class I SAM-dependent methyltransferase [Candidatus Acetothermia bacterium]|jgi:hypothetical protein|nr:class I SAM-dependent methyltransferase [Candidatus Acetothermia bacterium]
MMHDFSVKSWVKSGYCKGGIFYVLFYGPVKVLYRVCKNLFIQAYLNARSPKTFTFQGKTYPYFYHRYNRTWENERTVEVPIIWDVVKNAKGKRILEVGHVLSHYFPCDHDVLDKYEKSRGIINEDVVNFRPSQLYDLIVSISTLEHVGWDEEEKDRYKILRALENLTRCLAPRGEMIVTLPFGYNREMDKLLKESKMSFMDTYYLERISQNNQWQETTWKRVREAKYNTPFPYANALAVGVIKNEKT